jgi:hypothetical protein
MDRDDAGESRKTRLMIATLMGSTGLTGSFLVRQLLADPAIAKVISVSRKPLNISNSKLTEVLISDPADLPSIQPKIRGELYFCCLGTTIKAARQQGKLRKSRSHRNHRLCESREGAQRDIIQPRLCNGGEQKVDVLLQPSQGPD